MRFREKKPCPQTPEQVKREALSRLSPCLKSGLQQASGPHIGQQFVEVGEQLTRIFRIGYSGSRRNGPRRPSGTGRAHRSGGAGRTRCSSGACRAGRTGRARRTHHSGGAHRSHRPGQSRHTGRTYRPGKAPRSPRPGRPRNAADAAALARTPVTAAGFRFIAIVSHTESSFLYFSCAAQRPRPLQYMPPRPAGARLSALLTDFSRTVKVGVVIFLQM